MPEQKSFDPLTFIPSPDAIRRRLREAEQLASRLKILLDTSERITIAEDDPTELALPAAKEVH